MGELLLLLSLSPLSFLLCLVCALSCSLCSYAPLPLPPSSYAVVRKEQLLPKPTPPARRKKFTRLPGEQRFATLPNMRGSRGSPPPARPPPPKEYTPSEDSPLQPRSQRHRRSLEELPTQAQTQSPLLLVKSK